MERWRVAVNSGARNHGVGVIVVFISSSRIVAAALPAQPSRVDRESAERQAFSRRAHRRRASPGPVAGCRLHNSGRIADAAASAAQRRGRAASRAHPARVAPPGRPARSSFRTERARPVPARAITGVGASGEPVHPESRTPRTPRSQLRQNRGCCGQRRATARARGEPGTSSLSYATRAARAFVLPDRTPA